MLIALLFAASPMPHGHQETAPATPAPKKICRRGEETGSRLRAPSICRTQAEWDAIEKASGDQASRAMERERQQR